MKTSEHTLIAPVQGLTSAQVRQRVARGQATTAQLVVLGSRGLGGFTGLLVGSIAVVLTSHGQCPIAIIRGADAGTGPVVVGVDGPSSEAAIGYAFDTASRRGVQLVALHAWTEGLLPSR